MNSAAFSPDGQLVVTANDDNTARLWKAGTGELVAELKGHTDKVVGAEFSRDGGLMVTASNDRTARVWQTNMGKSIAELTGHSGAVLRAVFSPDGKLVLTAGDDSTARLWSASSGKNVARSSTHLWPNAIAHLKFTARCSAPTESLLLPQASFRGGCGIPAPVNFSHR